MNVRTSNKSSLAKKFALGFGIAVLFPLTIHYGVSTFSPAPKWEDYQVKHYHTHYQNASQEEQTKLEEEQSQLDEKRKEHEKRFQRHLFFVTTPMGILAIILGSFIAVQAVGSGLMFGGIFCLIDGYINYWSELPDSMRFVSLLMALIVLVFIGFKKFRESSEHA